MAQKCQEGWDKAWSKVESKLGPSMLRNIIGPSLDSRMVICVFFFFFLWKSHCPCRNKTIFGKEKGKISKLGPSVDSKGPFLDQVLTLQYIYMCCGVIIWSKFGLFNSYYLVQVRFLTLFVKKHYKIGVSDFFWKSARANLNSYFLVQFCAF